MITIKNEIQLSKMRSAGHLLYDVLCTLREKMAPGMTTLDLDRIAHELIVKGGAKPSFLGYYDYPATLCVSIDDEVVHGKGSLIGKMAGSYEEKFATMRAFMTFLMSFPGKKMLFMGTEFAQFREWDFENSLEWFMLQYPRHREMQHFVKTINHLYLSRSSLWEIDDGWDGFEWSVVDDKDTFIGIITRGAIVKYCSQQLFPED